MTKFDFISGKPFKVNGLPYAYLEYQSSNEKLIYVDEQQVLHSVSVILSKRDSTFTALLPVFGIVQCVTINMSFCASN